MATIYKNMAKLVDICYNHLNKDKEVKEYLHRRNISQRIIDKFFIGSFPKNINTVIKEFKPEFLIKNGLAYQADKSPFQIYQLIIPICDVNDNFIGIGGRTLLSEDKRNEIGIPKYKNSQYDKTNHLFGLNLAKQSIRDKNNAIVVEGYFDVISSHQHDLTNTVSTSGTFFSSKQLLLLSRYTENISLLFDNDPAGQRATQRALDKKANEGVNIKKISLPDGFKDIDEYLNSKSYDLNAFNS